MGPPDLHIPPLFRCHCVPYSDKMSAREPRFNQQVLIDTTPLPDHIPKVPEIGASSAPLLSASYFIGARCKPYNDDYMHCKDQSNGKGEMDCLREGRSRGVRAASSRISTSPASTSSASTGSAWTTT